MQQLGKCPASCLPSNHHHSPSGQVHVRESETTNTYPPPPPPPFPRRHRPSRNRFSEERINLA